MKARLIAVGERAPAWVAEGFAEYQKRLSHWLPLELVDQVVGAAGVQIVADALATVDAPDAAELRR